MSTLRSRPRSRRLVTALCAAALTLVASACGGPGGAGSGAGEPTTSIVTGWPIDVATMDPATASNDQDKELTLNVYQRLLEYKMTEDADGNLVWDGLASEGSLAESWDISGSSVTFHLRQGVKFHPSGNPLTAEDVRWSTERVLALGGGDHRNGGIRDASQVTVVDDQTVTFTFTDAAGNPAPASETLLATFRMPASGIVDSVEAKTHATPEDPYAATWLTSNTAGTGPYYIASRTVGQEIQLAPVPDSWKPQPEITSVTIRILQNGNVASLIRGGEINEAMFGLTPKDVTDLGDAGFKTIHIATPDFIFMQLAENTGPFADNLVRQAVAYAIPYDDLVNDVYFGLAERAESYVNVKAPGYNPAWSTYATNLDKAKELMRQAGNPTFDVTFRYNNAEPAYEDMAILIQSSLKALGINVTLVPMLKAQLTANIRERALAKAGGPTEDAMVMNNLSIYIDDPKSPVAFYTRTGASSNYMRFSNPEVDGLADTYQFAEMSDDREKAYQRIQEVVAGDAGFIPLVRTGRSVVLAPGLTGASFTPEIGMRFWTLHSEQS
jgi:peptide/nickel transport system substrate-binding protein